MVHPDEDNDGRRLLDPELYFVRRWGGVGRVPPVDCPCWRLTWPLAGEPLPDHVCLNTMAATVYHHDTQAGAALTPDIAWPVRYVGDPLDGRGCPVPGAPPRLLGLILREWAEEDPSRTFAAELASLASPGSWEGMGWRWAVSSAGAEFRRWSRRHPDAGAEAWVFDAALDEEYRRVFGVQLARAGVLPTPSVLCHLRALGAAWPKTHETLPARGLLVTTLVFVRTGPIAEYGVRYDGNPGVHLAGPSELMTGPIWDRAGAVARRHRDWLRKQYGGHPLADRTFRYRSQAGAFLPSTRRESEDLDFVAEALRDVTHLAPARWRDGRERDLAVTRHLDNAYRRVLKRRQRAGIDPTPPLNWRTQVRSVLDS